MLKVINMAATQGKKPFHSPFEGDKQRPSEAGRAKFSMVIDRKHNYTFCKTALYNIE
jgi:hypothetical protein